MPKAGGEQIPPPKDGANPGKTLPPGPKSQGNPVIPNVTPASTNVLDLDAKNPF
jgi:hypothetical protein